MALHSVPHFRVIESWPHHIAWLHAFLHALSAHVVSSIQGFHTGDCNAQHCCRRGQSLAHTCEGYVASTAVHAWLQEGPLTGLCVLHGIPVVDMEPKVMRRRLASLTRRLPSLWFW